MNPWENHLLALWKSFAVVKPMFSFFLILFIASTVWSPQKNDALQFTFGEQGLFTLPGSFLFVGDLKHQLLEDKEVINHLHGRRRELRNVSEDRVRKQFPSFTL